MRTRILVTIIFALLLVSQMAYSGNIDATYKYAWSENTGWSNWEPTHGGGVSVYPDHLEGYAWAENIGWVRMGTYTGGGSHTYTNADKNTYGVNVDGSGNLSGYAWSENVGWIKFDPTYQGVTVNISTGEFDGYAWAENFGWIHFKNASPEYNVKTTNTPLPVELSDFHAEVVPGGIQLHWSTASEMNNAGFKVYRKAGDLPGFQNLEGLIPGAGTTSEPQEYSFTDKDVQPNILYTYQIADVEEGTNKETLHPAITIMATKDALQSKEIPKAFALHANYPNPFNPETTIEFDVPDLTGFENLLGLTLKIYDASGKLVKTLIDEPMEAGSYSVIWDGKDDNGNVVNSGTYFCKMRTENYSKTRRCVMLK